jgi:hypothetical protein
MISKTLPHPALSKGEGSNTYFFRVLAFGEDLGEANKVSLWRQKR